MSTWFLISNIRRLNSWNKCSRGERGEVNIKVVLLWTIQWCFCSLRVQKVFHSCRAVGDGVRPPVGRGGRGQATLSSKAHWKVSWPSLESVLCLSDPKQLLTSSPPTFPGTTTSWPRVVGKLVPILTAPPTQPLLLPMRPLSKHFTFSKYSHSWCLMLGYRISLWAIMPCTYDPDHLYLER